MGRISLSAVYSSVIIEVPLIGIRGYTTSGSFGKLNYITRVSCCYIGAEISGGVWR